VRRGIYLRSYALAFIEKVCPDDLGEENLKAAIQKQERQPAAAIATDHRQSPQGIAA
jgi:hypothetical protein